MKKEILNEVNRYRELMSLGKINIISEGTVGDILKKIGQESVENEIEAFMKAEAKKLAIEEMKRGATTSLRGGEEAAKKLSDDVVKNIYKEIESKAGVKLMPMQKATIKMDLKRAMVDEIKMSANQIGKEAAENIEKQGFKKPKGLASATWQALKKHFGNNWGKYLAAGTAAAIFAYYWPNEPIPTDGESNVWEKYPCVPNHPGSQQSEDSSGGIVYEIGNYRYYGNGRKMNKDTKEMSRFTCSDPPFNTDDGSIDPGTSRYRDCGSGPFSKGCYETDRNGPIHKVQSCLGITSDGKFWNVTERMLINITGKNSFTKDDVNTICGSSNTTTSNVETNAVNIDLDTGSNEASDTSAP